MHSETIKILNDCFSLKHVKYFLSLMHGMNISHKPSGVILLRAGVACLHTCKGLKKKI